MGLKKRVIPRLLPQKLKFIRKQFNLKLEDLCRIMEIELDKLGYKELKVFTGSITEYEKGKREPQLPILLAYARLANVYVDVLLDDDLQMPEVLPAANK